MLKGPNPTTPTARTTRGTTVPTQSQFSQTLCPCIATASSQESSARREKTTSSPVGADNYPVDFEWKLLFQARQGKSGPLVGAMIYNVILKLPKNHVFDTAAQLKAAGASATATASVLDVFPKPAP